MVLNDTLEMMKSDDYKERFKAEYYQVKIRYEALRKVIIRYQAGTLNFNPSCSVELLKTQANVMLEYMSLLEIRAEIEKIDL